MLQSLTSESAANKTCEKVSQFLNLLFACRYMFSYHHIKQLRLEENL